MKESLNIKRTDLEINEQENMSKTLKEKIEKFDTMESALEAYGMTFRYFAEKIFNTLENKSYKMDAKEQRHYMDMCMRILGGYKADHRKIDKTISFRWSDEEIEADG